MSGHASNLLGQIGERRVGIAAWVQDHPDGGRVPVLLIHPHGHGAAAPMARLAGVLGLERADQNTTGRPVDVPPDITHVRLGETPDGRAAILHTAADGEVHRPITPEWEAATSERHQVLVLLGLDGLASTRDERAVERYLTRPHRNYLGLMRVM